MMPLAERLVRVLESLSWLQKGVSVCMSSAVKELFFKVLWRILSISKRTASLRPMVFAASFEITKLSFSILNGLSFNFNENKFYESIKLLNYSLSINKYDLMTKELQLKNYIFTNQNNKAYELVKDLLNEYPNNKNYSELFQVISRDLFYS